MGLLNLVALAFGLVFFTVFFGTIFACKKMRRNARKNTLQMDPVPWEPDLSQSYVAQVPPAKLLPPYVGVTQQRYVMDTEQGYVWTR